jgi:hypothetical protein
MLNFDTSFVAGEINTARIAPPLFLSIFHRSGGPIMIKICPGFACVRERVRVRKKAGLAEIS